MAVNPMLSAAGNSLTQGVKALDSVASEIAHLNISTEQLSGGDSGSLPQADDGVADTAQAMVDLKLYQRQVQASAQVVQTADQVLGFLLDVHN